MRRPWSARAEELRKKDGPYADYSAWLEWMSGRQSEDLSVAMDEWPVHTTAEVYALMCKAADEADAGLRGERDALSRDLTGQAEGTELLKDLHGAKEGETLHQMVDRIHNAHDVIQVDLNEAVDAYDLVEKHRGEAAALLKRALGCLEAGMGGATWDSGSDLCAVEHLYRDIKRELPRLSGGVYDENGNATEGSA